MIRSLSKGVHATRNIAHRPAYIYIYIHIYTYIYRCIYGCSCFSFFLERGGVVLVVGYLLITNPRVDE